MAFIRARAPVATWEKDDAEVIATADRPLGCESSEVPDVGADDGSTLSLGHLEDLQVWGPVQIPLLCGDNIVALLPQSHRNPFGELLVEQQPHDSTASRPASQAA